jgi:hypothetical protein
MNKMLRILAAFGFVASIVIGLAGSAKADEGSDYTAKVIAAKSLLDLSGDQVAQLESIKAAAKKEAGPTVLQYLVDLKNLKGKVEAGASDGDLTGILNKMEAERQNLEGMKTKYIGQVRAVLNPMQQSKLALVVAKIKWEMLKKVAR